MSRAIFYRTVDSQNEDDNSRQRGLNKMAADVQILKQIDVRTTKSHGRERDGADDIHHEGYGRRTSKLR
jgi:hypothetical protein